MQRPTKYAATRVSEVARGWATLRLEKKLYGMTLEEYRQRVRPYTDALAEVADLEKHREYANAKRDLASGPAMKLTKRIVNAMKGDPEEAEDRPL